MSATTKRSVSEKLFIAIFVPAIILFYCIYKYPTWFVDESQVANYFYWFGKSTSFWYMTIYTFFVCFICVKVLFKNRSAYSSDATKPLSNYQKWKWRSIFASQLILFYLIPFVVPYLKSGAPFFADTYTPVGKDAYIYMFNGFTSMGGFIYLFVLVPIAVWFFGKRYCSWFCACGNLAETAGVTKLGSKWVKNYTPRGPLAQKMEWLQFAFMAFGITFGLVLFLDAWQIFSSPSLKEAMRHFQDFVVDFMFGAIVGVGAYPFLGTRVWCRYGCPAAQFMKLFGKFSRSKFKVQANSSCKGLGLCSKVCPMGIDVEGYAHKNKVAINGSFSLNDTPCIGCGGCVDICPVKALSFQKILNPKKMEAVQ